MDKKKKRQCLFTNLAWDSLKRLVFDMEDVSSATPKYKQQVYKQSRAWDYLIAANQYSSDIFQRCFMFEKTMLETGYPRNDILHHKDKDAIAERLKEKLGIPKDKNHPLCSHLER